MNIENLMAGGATYTPLTEVAAPEVEAPEGSPCIIGIAVTIYIWLM